MFVIIAILWVLGPVWCILGDFLMSYNDGVEIIVMNYISVGMGFKCNHMFHKLQKGLEQFMF